MPKAAINRADLLRVIVSSQKAIPDKVIQSLGFCADQEEDKPTATDASPVTVETIAETTEQAIPDNSKPFIPIGFWQPILYIQEKIIAKAQKTTRSFIEMPTRADNGVQPEYTFLVEFKQLIPRIHKILSQLHTSKSYDIEKIVARISQGEHLSCLPHQYRPGWGGSLYIIEDRSDYLTPYIRDQAMVFEHLRDIYSHTGFFAGIYNEYYSWPQLNLADNASADIQPLPGDQVLILSDLGALALDGGKTSDFWLEFGHKMTTNGVNLIALLPCHIDECPSPLTAFYQRLSWEHPAPKILSQSELEQKGQCLLTHLSIVERIKPGLLRDIRNTLTTEQYPARLESWVWQHIGNFNLLGASFCQNNREQYFNAFEQDKKNCRKTLRLAQQWMNDLPYELWLQSVLKLVKWAKQNDAKSGVPAIISQKEQNDAIGLIEYMANHFESEGHNSFSERSWLWIEDFINDIDKHVNNRPELAGPLRTLKKAILQRQTGYIESRTSNEKVQTFNIFHSANQLIFQPTKQDPIENTSPIAQIESQDGFIQIEAQFWLSGNAPNWATNWGYDNYGPWVEFEINHCHQKMRWIPPGEFIMGSPEEEPGRDDSEGPQHHVLLKSGYWLFDTPVTQALWQAVMGNNPSTFKTPQRPVENVNWQDVQKFIRTLNHLIPDLQLSLPTEAQWEYACRAGTSTAL